MKIIVFVCALFLVNEIAFSQDKLAVFERQSSTWLHVDDGFKTSFNIILSDSEKMDFQEKLTPLNSDVKSEMIKIGKNTYRVNLVFKPETNRAYPIKIFSFLDINACEVAGQRMSVDETFIK